MTVVALHGFLGRPADWDFLNPDVAPALDAMPIVPLRQWAQEFNRKVEAPGLLLGYSLGGRLALHCCIENPKLWHAAVIVSANAGLSSPEDRSRRLQHDEQWAARFESEEWDPLMQAWDAQPALQSSARMPRNEAFYNRATLAAMLRIWSLGNQENLVEAIRQLPMPILWIAGENDFQYAAQARNLSFAHPLSQVVVVADAGHRVPWDSSATFIKLIDSFRSNR